MLHAFPTLRSRAVATVVVVVTCALAGTVWGQEAADPAEASPPLETVPVEAGADAGAPADAGDPGGSGSTGTETTDFAPPSAADDFQPSAPGSFFRSAEPPPDDSAASPPADAEGSAFGDGAAPAAESVDGMSSFGAPPPFSAPAYSPPPEAIDTSGATASPPPATSFGAAPLGSPPPQENVPAQPFDPSGTAATAAPGFAAPPAADGTRSVLTAPPATLPPAGFASPAAPVATPPAYADGPLAPAQPPESFDAAAGNVPVATNAADDAASQQPAMPSGPATTLIDLALEAVENGGGPAILNGLASRPLPLLEALERSGDRGRRLWITQAYWKLVERVAVLRWTAEAAERLDLVAPSGDPHDRATLDVAVASRLADVAAARAALVSAQQELVDLVRLPATEPLPWPVDQPLATSYETHFDVLFASRIATGRIRAIHRSLPLEHEEVDARAAAVLAAVTAVEMAENDHARGTRGIESVIAAHAALLDQQRALAGAVTRYNDDIVEYVMAVADFSVPDEQFATMLIGAPTPWRPPVTLTSATVPVAGVPTLAPPAGASAGEAAVPASLFPGQ